MSHTRPEIDARKRIHEAIQDTNDSNRELEEAVLIGWALVAEWSDPEGERWLSTASGSGSGEDSPPFWQTRGYLHEALQNWPSSEE